MKKVSISNPLFFVLITAFILPAFFITACENAASPDVQIVYETNEETFSPPNDALIASNEAELKAWLADTENSAYNAIVYKSTLQDSISVPAKKTLYLSGTQNFIAKTNKLTVEPDGTVFFYSGDFTARDKGSVDVQGTLIAENLCNFMIDTKDNVTGLGTTITFKRGSLLAYTSKDLKAENLSEVISFSGDGNFLSGTISVSPSAAIEIAKEFTNENRSIHLNCSTPETAEALIVPKGIILSTGNAAFPNLHTLTVDGVFSGEGKDFPALSQLVVNGVFSSFVSISNKSGVTVKLGKNAVLLLLNVAKLADNIIVPASAVLNIHSINDSNGKTITFNKGNTNPFAPHSDIDLVFSDVSEGVWILNDDTTLSNGQVISMTCSLGIGVPAGKTFTNNGEIYLGAGDSLVLHNSGGTEGAKLAGSGSVIMEHSVITGADGWQAGGEGTTSVTIGRNCITGTGSAPVLKGFESASLTIGSTNTKSGELTLDNVGIDVSGGGTIVLSKCAGTSGSSDLHKIIFSSNTAYITGLNDNGTVIDNTATSANIDALFLNDNESDALTESTKGTSIFGAYGGGYFLGNYSNGQNIIITALNTAASSAADPVD
ncbi:hypothetical protein AGMMS50212_00480 [Spirochaetia bacterium]|nr:hypothetical protein AGMMS50212_00480 [Spirochaetia bacterium]